jgi:hypothetical protein
MRWKTGGDHDPRHIDLLVAVVLFIAILGAWRFYSGAPEKPDTTAFIVPSQSVRW